MIRTSCARSAWISRMVFALSPFSKQNASRQPSNSYAPIAFSSPSRSLFA
jgi:hypothetical protein